MVHVPVQMKKTCESYSARTRNEDKLTVNRACHRWIGMGLYTPFTVVNSTWLQSIACKADRIDTFSYRAAKISMVPIIHDGCKVLTKLVF